MSRWTILAVLFVARMSMAAQFQQVAALSPFLTEAYGFDLATMGLLTVIFGGLRWRPESIAMLVGLYITAAYWFTASTSFANPAVTIARSFTDSFSGILPSHAPGFILAQLAAALVAPLCLGWLFADWDRG